MTAEIGLGLVGGGYMGKAHAVAFGAVHAVFGTVLRPRLEVIAAASPASAEGHRAALGFARATGDWRELVADPRVEAVVIAAPQDLHRPIAEAALARGKPVLCEKPLGATLADSRAMAEAARAAGVVAMTGFNYVRTPATQFARALVAEGAIGEVTAFRAEHTEDFLADPDLPATWRTRGAANGAMGDLAPHIVNAALAFLGPIRELVAEVETVHAARPSPAGGREAVTNDDQAAITCRFASGVLGQIFVSRVATGRKMGYAYDIAGTRGAIRFDGEDQNSLWLYRAEGPEATRGFARILAGPAHPDYAAFCLGPGHGTGYGDQIAIEARDFLEAIAGRRPCWPSFQDGYEVDRVVATALESARTRAWTPLLT